MRTTNRIVAGIAIAAVIALGVTAPAATAATNLTVAIGTTAVGDEIDSTGGVLYYNSAKGDSAADGYQVAYRGSLTMDNVWSTYQSARSVYILSQVLKNMSAAEATERWERFKVIGGYEIGFTVDQNYVGVDSTFITCDAVQSRYEAENPGPFTQLMTCQSVTYSVSSGRYVAKFETKHKDGSAVSTKELDEAAARPAKLILSTPETALQIKQSDFSAGESFVMTDAYVRGSLSLDLLFIPQLPINFASTEVAPVALAMADTYSASHFFEAANDTDPALPAEVLDQLPADTLTIRPGTVVTPAELANPVVELTEGVWTFEGWNSASETVVDANVSFVGAWSFARAATYSASFGFVAADAALSLPAEVTELLPATEAGLYAGTVVIPPVPARPVVKLTEGVWTFEGWDSASETVVDADLVFVAAWSFVAAAKVADVPPAPSAPPASAPPASAPAPVGGKPASTTGTSLAATGGVNPVAGALAMLILAAGSLVFGITQRRLRGH